MRRIAKSWPPGNVSPPGQVARSLAEKGADLQISLKSMPQPSHHAHARSIFDGMEKLHLRAVMYREQRYLCVFCERVIDESSENRIDHWIPLEHDPAGALDWHNLYLSCGEHDTCDSAKGGKYLARFDGPPSLPTASQADYERWLGFTSVGDVYVRSDANLSASDRAALEWALHGEDPKQADGAVLALNIPKLRAARKAALDSEMDKLRRANLGKLVSLGDRAKLAAAMLAAAKRPPFVSIRVAWLQRQLGKGRP